jgi:hypothetical protein
MRQTHGMPATRAATWSTFAAAAPDVAEAGRRVLERHGDGAGMLATVRGAAPPRIHPINVAVVDGGLYTFLLDSAKRRDLAEDGRFALHAHQDPADPTEFAIRGRAQLVPAGPARDRVASGWSFEVDDTYWLFELRIDAAILGERTADEWPPRYRRWPTPA